jgi:hypothetical protein
MGGRLFLSDGWERNEVTGYDREYDRASEKWAHGIFLSPFTDRGDAASELAGWMPIRSVSFSGSGTVSPLAHASGWCPFNQPTLPYRPE